MIFYNGTTFENITNGALDVQPGGVLGKTLNNSGNIAFGTESGLFLYNGTQVTDIFAGTGLSDMGNAPPSLNSNNDIAFHAVAGGRRDAFLFNGSTFTNLSDDPSLQISMVPGFTSINDSSHVLFLGVTSMSGQNSTDLFFFDGLTTTNLTGSLGLPGDIGSIALNNNDEIAYIADSRDLYFVSDGRSELVYSANGYVGGLTMNDSAEMAFFRQNDVFFAEPGPTTPAAIPEPSSFIVWSLLVPVGLGMGRRRNTVA